jgi:acyl-CoA reductase-like NAD-dependent aldehyde dehydrogenase
VTSVESGVRTYGQLIGGEWGDAAAGGTFENLDPYTGEVFARNAAGGAADAARAVEAAAAAFPAWSESPPGERQRVFLKAADILERRLDEVVGLLARESGASFGFGMFQTGPCFQATLITDVPAGSELARHETFGPVAAVEVVDGADTAVARANDTAYGLSAGIITADRDRGFALARRIESGIVHVNDQTVADEPQMPFGGVKESGFGRFGGQAVVDEFTELRWVTVRSGSHPFPF